MGTSLIMVPKIDLSQMKNLADRVFGFGFSQILGLALYGVLFGRNIHRSIYINVVLHIIYIYI